jgi:hypothetical protein
MFRSPVSTPSDSLCSRDQTARAALSLLSSQDIERGGTPCIGTLPMAAAPYPEMESFWSPPARRAPVAPAGPVHRANDVYVPDASRSFSTTRPCLPRGRPSIAIIERSCRGRSVRTRGIWGARWGASLALSGASWLRT